MGVTCNTNCNLYAPFSAEQKELCRARKNCACKCKNILSAYPTLVAGCEAGCHGSPKQLDNINTAQDYLCQSPQDAFNKHGIICKGFDPLTQSADGVKIQQSYQERASNAQLLWWGIGLLLVLLIIYVIR